MIIASLEFAFAPQIDASQISAREWNPKVLMMHERVEMKRKEEKM